MGRVGLLIFVVVVGVCDVGCGCVSGRVWVWERELEKVWVCVVVLKRV